ncbi:MAG: acyl-CoA dehydratase activase [Pseudomonadota bacterium]
MSDGALYCGVDIGASATKLVLINEAGEVRARSVALSGVDYAGTARLNLQRALGEIGASDDQIRRTVATGYGRRNVPFAQDMSTEIQCHGMGCYHLVPRAITVVDIGGQDNKVIRLDGSGHRVDFKMNRKCAAGTGSFIEEIALRLALEPGQMEPLAASTDRAVKLSSFCTVFAKTEILSHLREGVPVAEIVRGSFLSVIHRVVEMDTLDGEVVLTGGVIAHNPTIGTLLAERLGRPITVPPHPQYTGALGAALMARRQATVADTRST